MRGLGWVLGSAFFALVSCASDAEVAPLVVPEGCQPLASELSCSLPFPSDFYKSGDRVEMRGAAKLVTKTGIDADVTAAFPTDGASALPTIVAALPSEVVGDGLPNLLDDPMASTLATSPTLLIDTTTGKAIPHYVDLEPRPTEPGRRAISLRAFAPLTPKTRYVAVLRGVKDASGKRAKPGEGFRRLRDKVASKDASLTALAPRFEADVFSIIAKFGVPRAELQLAWDFTTGSDEAPRRDMIRVRELTLAWLANNEPHIEITEVKENDDRIWRLVRGTIEAPLFLDKAEPGGRLARDASGQVVQNGTTTFRLLALVPDAVKDSAEPGRALEWGHGFFSAIDRELEGNATRVLANRLTSVVFGTDWWGMTNDDLAPLIGGLIERPTEAFRFVERVHQAMANWIVLDAAIRGPMTKLEVFHRPAGSANAGAVVYDASRVRLFGVSQSHILGGTLAALDPGLDRVVLEVGGGAFTHLMPRAKPFAPFQYVLSLAFADSLETNAMVATLTSALDRIDPATYAPLVIANPLPGSPADRRVLMQIGLGDAAVPNVGSFFHARALGLSMTSPSPRAVFGIPQADASTLHSALTLYDFGIDTGPSRDPLPLPDNDVHLSVRANAKAVLQMDAFLRDDSTIIAPCDGPCDPE
ncbi:MAG: hypothetical protein JWM74_2599 [Myxococcaceae bacterium]|nr:hypothetical protein [Myxococcaceae bacterium]